jgi:hypothetical protein
MGFLRNSRGALTESLALINHAGRHIEGVFCMKSGFLRNSREALTE